MVLVLSMMIRPTFALLAVAATTVVASACAPEARLSYAEVQKAPLFVGGDSTLVAIDTGVWVVRDADHAVYFVDGAYWTIDAKKWFRSPRYDGGWEGVDDAVVPRSIADRNHAYYTQYHGEATALTKRPVLGDDRSRQHEPSGAAPHNR